MRKLLIIFGLFISNIAFSNVQEVYVNQSQISQNGVNVINLEVIHTTDRLEALTGLGLILEYDSKVLELIDVIEVSPQNHIATSKTDNMINTAWFSLASNWGIDNDQKLYTAQFKFRQDSNQTQANIAFKATSLSATYEFIDSEYQVYR